MLEDIAEGTETWYMIQNCYSEEDAKNKFMQKFLPHKSLKFEELKEAFGSIEINIHFYCNEEIIML